MLSGIKKLLIILGVLSILLIAVEEFVQHTSSSIFRTYSKNWISYMDPQVYSLINNVNLTINDEDNNALSIRDAMEVYQHVKDEEEEEDGVFVRPSNNMIRQNIDMQEPADDYRNGETIFTNFKEEISVDGIQSPSKNEVISEDDGEFDEAEERRLGLSPYIYHHDEEMKRLSLPPVQTTIKLVSYFLPWDLDRHSLSRFNHCRYNKCRYVNNMSQADAVLFRASLVRDHIIPKFYRPKNQRWIFFTSDPAIKIYALERSDIGSNFNWTITYQLDSDYPNIFGALKRIEPQPRDFEALYAGKDRQVAWFVSHCPTWSKREEYVKKMSDIVQVDVYGKCGNLTCGPIHFRGNDSTECLPMLTKHYKFYLAFENSFCKDYVSEKFFKLFQNVDVIPVVRGGFNYKKYLPSGIFVDSSDFKTPQDLAHYLVELGNNKKKYISMLHRKSRWIEIAKHSFQCTVCEALHTAEHKTQFYSNLKVKFNGDPSDCWLPPDLKQDKTTL